VKKGEEKPVINFGNSVEGPVSKPLVFEVPFTGKFPPLSVIEME
jgi:hypothetical protein